jgi:hypothetical protein
MIAIGAALLLSVALRAEAPPDPAADPPPLLEDVPASPEAAPPPAPAPPAAPAPVDPAKPDAATRSLAALPHDDVLMLGADYVIIFIPVVGSVFLAPLAQGLMHGYAGERLVENEYPNWWVGMLAGYAVNLVGVSGLIGGYVVGATGLLLLSTNPQGPAPGYAALIGGTALGVTSFGLLLSEPLVVYLVARSDAQPVTSSSRPR